jgi:hypothetical protein
MKNYELSIGDMVTRLATVLADICELVVDLFNDETCGMDTESESDLSVVLIERGCNF